MCKLNFVGFEAVYPKLIDLILKLSIKENFCINYRNNKSIECSEKITFYWDHFTWVAVDMDSYNILILAEPPAVFPRQYRDSVFQRFDCLITFGAERAKNYGIKHYFPCIPYEVGKFMHFENQIPKNFKIDYRLKQGIVMINSNKFSAIKSSNYRIRRKIAKEFKNDPIFALYGKWNLKKSVELRARFAALRNTIRSCNYPHFQEIFGQLFTNYRVKSDHVDNKFINISKYKFNLVIENQSDWITEKIFDSIKCGCVPLYIGPSLSNFPKLQKCAVLINPNKLDKLTLLEKISNQDIKDKIKNIKKLNKDKIFWKKINFENQWMLMLKKIKNSEF
jgi:hypothetical protein